MLPPTLAEHIKSFCRECSSIFPALRQGDKEAAKRMKKVLPENIFDYIRDDVFSMEYIVIELNKARTDMQNLEYLTIEK